MRAAQVWEFRELGAFECQAAPTPSSRNDITCAFSSMKGLSQPLTCPISLSSLADKV